MLMPDLQSALTDDILNSNGQMIEPISGRPLSLADAIGCNLIIEVLITNDSIPRITRVSEIYRLRVESVLDAMTKQWMTLEDALEAGVISKATGEYIDELNGTCEPLELAVTNGRVKGKLLEVVRKKEEVARQRDDNFDVGLTLIDGQHFLSRTAHVTTSRIIDAEGLSKTVYIRGVLDPATGAEISVKEAIELGLLDPITKQFIDQQTGERIPLDRAIALGLIVADVDRQVREDVTQLTYSIGAVRDPATAELIHPSLAVARGLLDMVRGVYVEPITGKVISLAEAMEQGLIRAEPLEGESETLELSLKTTVTNAVQHGRTVFSIKHVRDPSTGELLHPDEAVNRGILDTVHGLYIDPLTGTTMLLHEAFESGLIDADELDRQPESSIQSITASRDSRSFTIVAVVDPQTNVQLTVMEAISHQLLDESCCKFTDPRNGQQMSIRSAIDRGFVIVDYSDVRVSTSAQKDIRSYRVKSVIDPQTGEEIPLADAVRHKIIDKTNGTYWNMKTNELIPIEEAVRRGLLVTEPVDVALLKTSIIELDGVSYLINAVRDPRTGKEYDPVEAERRGLINKLQGVYIDPATGDKIPILEAIQRGLLTGRPLSAADYAELDDKVHSTTGTSHRATISDIRSVLDPSSGKKVRAKLFICCIS